MKELLSLEAQLGYYVGEYVWPNLPTLNIDMLTSRKVINVGDEEYAHFKLLEKTWFNNYHVSNRDEKSEKNLEWINMTNFRREMEVKYLPHIWETFIPSIQKNADFNMLDFKKGFEASLWDCDLCNYKIRPEDVEITEDVNSWFNKITLKLDMDYDSKNS